MALAKKLRLSEDLNQEGYSANDDPTSDSEVDPSDSEENDEVNVKAANKQKQPAWVDEGDTYTCQEAIDIQGRRCNFGANASKDYKKSLEEKYRSVMGVPKWAERKTKQDDDWLSKSGNLVAKSTALEKGTIAIQKLKDLNRDTYCEGPVLNSVLFHPTSTVGLVAGASGIVSLFQVDGKSNTKLQSIQYRKFPINCAGFVRNGEEFIVGSQYHHYFYSHDLISGQSHKVANLRITDITNVKNFRITPDGKYIAVLGKFGNIHLLSAVTKELVCNLRMNGEVSSLSFSESTMFSHGTDGEVYVWDMNTRECVHKFIDDGCLTGTSIAASPDGRLLACGSDTGIVNIYDIDAAKKSTAPTPIKTVPNLVTSVNCVKFNATSEVLCLASNQKENAVKLLHTPSMTVFSNFPHFQARLNRPQCAEFSPNSGYLALGDDKKTAHLFRLKYFGNY